MKNAFPVLFLLSAWPLLAEPNVVDQLSPKQVTSAVEKIRSAPLPDGMIDEAASEKALLQGLLARLNGQATLVSHKSPSPETPQEAFHNEMLPRTVAYLRLGDLNTANVSALSTAVTQQSKTAAIILDLRATRMGDSYELASQVINLFGPKAAYFKTRDGSGKDGETFSGHSAPLYTGMVVVLINQDCSGQAETIAACLHQLNKALLVGTNTQGRAWQFAKYTLGDGIDLQVAVARVVLVSGTGDPAKGLKPDLPVEIDLTRERELLTTSAKDGVSRFVFEAERPHMNEASLVAGRNPEIDQYQARLARGNTPETEPLLDRTLQRALDTITTVLVYRTPQAAGH